jgi:hypothetical protein
MPESNLKEVILQRFKFSIGAYITGNMAKNVIADVLEEFDTDSLVLKLIHKPFGEILDTIQYPQNWKESVKEALYKRFKFGTFQKKHPVQYTIYNVNVYYPEISLPNEKHVITFKEESCGALK